MTILNTVLLERTADYIEAHPEHFDMESWVSCSAFWNEASRCGTTACIAGTSVMLTGITFPPVDGVGNVAADALGLPPGGEHHLFFRDRWPLVYSRDPASDADVAVRLLRDLAHNGWTEVFGDAVDDSGC
jgi:hypothetical protein